MLTSPCLRQRAFYILAFLLSGLLLAGCSPRLIDEWHQVWHLEERLTQAEADLQAQATQVSQLAQETQQALRVAEMAQSTADQALAAVGGTRPITTTPPSNETIIDGGVAISYTATSHQSIDFYTVDATKAFGREQFVTYRQQVNPASPATVLFAVAEIPNQTGVFTLYTTLPLVTPAPLRQLWQDYSTSTSQVRASDGTTSTLTTVALGGVALPITRTVTFTVPSGAILNTSLSALVAKVGDQRLIRRILLVDRSSGSPVYTHIVFEGDGSGAGTDAICAWCSSCGRACRWVCRRAGCP